MVQGMLRNLRRKIRCLKAPTSFAAHSLLKFARVLFETMMSRDRAFTCLRCLHLSCHVDRHEFWWCQMAGVHWDVSEAGGSFRCLWHMKLNRKLGTHNLTTDRKSVVMLKNWIIMVLSEFHLSILGHFVEFRIHNSFQNVRHFRAATKDVHKNFPTYPTMHLSPARRCFTFEDIPRSLQLPNWAPLSASHNELPFWLAKPGSLRDLLVQS